MKALARFCDIIDRINEWTGRIACWLIVPLSLIVTLDVTLRYVFDSPTTWAWDINVMIAGALVILGVGYVLLHRGHIGVDVLVSGLCQKKRAIIDAITFPVFAFTFGVLVWKNAVEAWVSVETRELYSGIFNPPAYPLRIAIAVGATFLLLEGLAIFIRNLLTIFEKQTDKL